MLEQEIIRRRALREIEQAREESEMYANEQKHCPSCGLPVVTIFDHLDLDCNSDTTEEEIAEMTSRDEKTYDPSCPSCGYDAHDGPCRSWTCRECGTECSERGCSLHPDAGTRVTEFRRTS